MPLKKYLDYDGLAYLLQRFPKTTVHCTFDDEFAGETATLTHGTTTYTKTVPATSPYELTFAVNELGTWTLQSSYLGTQYSDTVDITYLGQKGEVELSIVPDGSTAEPVNSIPTWLKCANLNKSYTTLAEVLADTETYETLLADNNACQYMKRSTGWAGANNLIPQMTGYTTPSGEVIYVGNVPSSYPAWQAFDRNSSTDGGIKYDIGNSVGYHFTSPVIVNRFAMASTDSSTTSAFVFEGSNDNNTYTELLEFVGSNRTIKFYDVENETAYSYYRVRITNKTENWGDFGFQDLQFYKVGITTSQDAMARLGKFDYCSNALLSNATWASAIANSDYSDSVVSQLVPKMTSNTTPSGEAFESNGYGGAQYSPWKAFDEDISTYWASYSDVENSAVGYKSTSKVVAYFFDFAWNGSSAYLPPKIQIQGSNDNFVNDINVLGEYTSNDYPTSSTKYRLLLESFGSYQYHRCAIIEKGSIPNFQVAELQFYGRKSVQATNTNIIHSAPNDTIYMLEDGSQVVLATTNSDGDGILDFSQLPAGSITLYSSVAKNPDDLTADYSKTITITKTQYGGTTEAYLRPSTIKTLYWWGYEDSNLEDCTSANGWYSSVNYTLGVHTHNTNGENLDATRRPNGAVCYISTKNKVSGNSIHAIGTGSTINLYGSYFSIFQLTSKDVSSNMVSDSGESSTTSSLTYISKSFPIDNTYIMCGCVDNGISTINAFWYE